MQRRHRMLWAALLGAWTVTGAAACGMEVGGQTGEEDVARPPVVVRIPGGMSSVICVQDEPVPLASLDEAPSGLSARQLLEMVADSGPFPLIWHPESPRGSQPTRTIEPPPGDAPDMLTLEVAYRGGSIHYLGPADCAGIHVEVEVSMRTESGALDEQTTAVLQGFEFERRPETREAWIELLLQPQGVRIDRPRGLPEGRAPAPRIVDQQGSLDVRMPLEYYPPEIESEELERLSVEDPDTLPEPLIEEGWLVAVPITVGFDTRGVHGRIEAWLRGTETERTALAVEIGTIGTE